MGNTSTTYTGPNGGKQKLTVKARKAKQKRDRKEADKRTEEKATAQVFRRNIKNVDLDGMDVHHRPDKSMVLVKTKTNRGHHIA